jgi:homogentisate 1,2-dioxygenase
MAVTRERAMPQYERGLHTRQAHVALPEGTVEEEHGRRGFYGRATHLYRLNAPTRWSDISGPLRPHAFDLNALPEPGDERDLPVDILVNDDVRLGVWIRHSAMPFFFREADGDLTLFVHRGSGTVETDFGPLAYRGGDYVVLPRGTTFRLVPTDPTWMLTIQTTAEVEPPDRGLLGRHALWDETAVRVPDVDPHDEAGDFEVLVRQRRQLTSIRYPFHPLDVVGWKGDLTAFALNVADLRPVSSFSYHLPPSAHTTFMAGNAVICSFVPRPLETDPQALKVPFYHRNIDYDEVIFYHHGDFFSRAGITPGMVSWHPQGIHHGPHPKAVKNAGTKDFADEIAVMVDCRNPLEATPAGSAVERSQYWASWME